MSIRPIFYGVMLMPHLRLVNYLEPNLQDGIHKESWPDTIGQGARLSLLAKALMVNASSESRKVGGVHVGIVRVDDVWPICFHQSAPPRSRETSWPWSRRCVVRFRRWIFGSPSRYWDGAGDVNLRGGFELGRSGWADIINARPLSFRLPTASLLTSSGIPRIHCPSPTLDLDPKNVSIALRPRTGNSRIVHQQFEEPSSGWHRN